MSDLLKRRGSLAPSRGGASGRTWEACALQMQTARRQGSRSVCVIRRPHKVHLNFIHFWYPRAQDAILLRGITYHRQLGMNRQQSLRSDTGQLVSRSMQQCRELLT